MKNHPAVWLKAFLLFLLCQGGLFSTLPAAVNSTPLSAELCELPPPDSAWIVGATTTSITVAWAAVPGAYSYKVAVLNLDGGGAPPSQFPLAPTTQATFNNLAPGKYLFSISATSCPGGEYGQSRRVVGGTAIIIDDVVYENCTPTHENLPLPNNVLPVCIPYGNSPDEPAVLAAYRIQGTYDPPLNQQGVNPPAFIWTIEFNLLMPCAGSFAFSAPVLENATAQVVGGYGTPFPSVVRFHPSLNGAPYDGIDLVTVTGARWWSTPPNPTQNNGCTGSYTASFLLNLINNPPSGTTVFVSLKDAPVPDVGGTGAVCYGKVPLDFLCLFNNPNVQPGNPNSDPTEAVPFDWETGQSAELRVAPNPFGTQTGVAYRLEKDAPVDLALYDALGRRVRTLEQRELVLAGVYRAELDAAGLPAGMYYLVLQTDRERRITPVVKNE